MSRMKKEFDIGDMLLHTDDKDRVIGWVSDKKDFGFGLEYTVVWADSFCNGEYYSYEWVESRVKQLQRYLENETT